MVQLSKADTKVLSQVFDPESSPATEILIDPYLPNDRHIKSPELLSKLQAQEKSAIRLIEDYESQSHSSQAEEEEETSIPTDDENKKHTPYTSALAILDPLVSAQPLYASALNNRAQLHRWRYGDHKTLVQNPNTQDPDRARAATSALRDLHAAIRLASPPNAASAVSPAQGKLLAQAHTQLAALYYAASRDFESSAEEGVEVVVVEGLGEAAGWGREVFEEEGSRHFYLGGMYGNEVARQLAVVTNPHAKVCGRIVREALRKEMGGEA